MSFYHLPHPWNPGYAIPKYVMAEPPERGTFTTQWLPRGTIPALVPDFLANPIGKKVLGRSDAELSGLGADCCCSGARQRTQGVGLGSLGGGCFGGSSLSDNTLAGSTLSGNSLGAEMYALRPLGADPAQTKIATETTSAPAAAKPGVSMGKVALVGAAILGAAYLFGKKKRR